MIRHLGITRTINAQTALPLAFAFLIGGVTCAAIVSHHDADTLTATIAATSGRPFVAAPVAMPQSNAEFVHTHYPAAYPTVATALKTLRAQQIASAPVHYGCLTLPKTITTASWGPITFACPVGVTYKTFDRHGQTRRMHVGIARSFALHPGIMHLGDSVRYELVPPQ